MQKKYLLEKITTNNIIIQNIKKSNINISMIKILIASELHLGFENNLLPITSNERLNTFKKITNLALNHDILILSGDFIDNLNFDEKTISVIKTEFNRLLNNNINIALFPSDNNSAKIINQISFDKKDNIFLSTLIQYNYSFKKNDQKLYLYGFHNDEKSRILTSVRKEKDGFHIGIINSDFDISESTNNSRNLSINDQDIRLLGLDFYTFGAPHNFKIYKSQESIIGASPGTPEAISKDDTGDRYIISLQINKNEIEKIKRLTVNSVRIEKLTFDCSEKNNYDFIIESINKLNDINMILYLELQGERNFVLPKNIINELQNNFLKLEITDNSIPSLSVLVNNFKNENSLRGDFYKILEEKIDQNNLDQKNMMKNLSEILHEISKMEVHQMEEWLCTLLNA